MGDAWDLLSLKNLSAAVVARSMVPKIDGCFLTETENIDHTSFIDALKEVMAPWAQVPNNLWTMLISELHKRSIYAGFVVSFIYSENIERIPCCGAETLQWTSRGQYTDVVSLPPMLLSAMTARLAAGLICLDVSNIYIDDQFMDALARSGAAQTLQKLVTNSNQLTDASAASFGALSQLRELVFDNKAFVGSKTVQTISKLPNLEVFKIIYAESGLPIFLHTVLAPEALPSLRILRCHQLMYGEQNVTVRDLRLIIERRSNRDTIEDLDVEIYLDEPDDRDYLALHALLPNWRGIPYYNSEDPTVFEKVSHKLPTWPRRVASEFRPVSTKDFIEAASKSPRLEHLVVTLDSFPRGNIPLSDFKCLNHVELSEMSHFTSISWPDTLQHLVVAVMSHEDPTALDRLVESLCTPALAKSLKNLTVRSFKGLFTEDHVHKLLASLPNLGSLTLGLVGVTSDSQQVKTIRFSHPKLHQIPTLIGINYMTLIPSWAPSFTSIRLDSRVSQPEISSVTVQSIDADSFSALVPLTQRSMPQHLRFHSGFSTRPDDLDLSIIKQMKSIVKFESTMAHSLDDLDLIFKSLPFLSHFYTAFSCSGSATISVAHPRLAYLQLAQHVGSPKPADPVPITISISADELPWLRHLILRLPNASVSNITLPNFDKLEEVALTLAKVSPVDVNISDCRRLRSLEFVSITFKSMHIHQVPSMVEMNLRECSLAEAFGRSDFSASLPASTGMTDQSKFKFAEGTADDIIFNL
eukprot:TRINITY_DN10519_c0_g1_i1.p1 TRINITY_DN10519_c0_g1~~TRINITY_DN10519_c0_g1_i1.p1  ORF type:complete len:754 (+),score=77.60 TRINITY_DN10519_c0_g1_i1:61-2322(+)